MSELTNMIQDMVDRLLCDTVDQSLLETAEGGVWHENLWNALEESGLPSMLTIPREQGGETGWREAFLVVAAAGRHCLPLPLPEAMAAGWLLASAGLEPQEGKVGVAGFHPDDQMQLRSGPSGWRADGKVVRVPWGRHLRYVAYPVPHRGETMIVVAPLDGCQVVPGTNLVGEPRDDLVFSDHAVTVAPCPVGLDVGVTRLLGALLRSAQMAGAVSAVLDKSVGYAGERNQFGRSISSFQAVQHMLAELAEESAAAIMAAEQAFLALDAGGNAAFAVAVAKTRTGEAAGRAAAIGHQVLGAMGFTHEHLLHHSTRRLWAWRAEFGGEAEWSQRLAALVVPHGGMGLWPFITEVQLHHNTKEGFA